MCILKVGNFGKRTSAKSLLTKYKWFKEMMINKLQPQIKLGKFN